MVHYVMRHPDIYEDKNELMNHEDYFTSYAFTQATGGTSPIIAINGLSEILHVRFAFSEYHTYKRDFPINSRFFSIRDAKKAEDIYKLHERFYDESGKPRELAYDNHGIVQ